MYLTKGERDLALIASYFPDLLRSWANDERYNLNKEEKRQVRSAATNLEKAWLSFVLRLDPDVYQKLRQNAANNDLVMAAKRTTTFKEEIRMERDVFYEIADGGIAWYCQTWKDGTRHCEHSGKGYRKCRLYKAMMEAEVPVVDPDVKGDCPFRIEYETKEK